MNKIIDWHGKKIIVGIASDHGGFFRKNEIVDALNKFNDLKVIDFGPEILDAQDDYPDFAAKLLNALNQGEITCGILLCTSGVGMIMHANRFSGIRAAFAYNENVAEKCREHNCTNIIVPGTTELPLEKSISIIKKWLDTPFSFEERHIRRLLKLERDSYHDLVALRCADTEIYNSVKKERKRQKRGIELIASENIVSAAVMEAQGTCLTNKYAEGYPGKRYYNGCEFVDQVESIAIKRACKIFDAEAANVQPHSGSQANMAAYFALLEPGDTVLAMALDHGGHLSHGMKINFSGKLFNFVSYAIDRETEQIDYDILREKALKHRPKLILAGASAYPRIIDFERFREIADEVGAFLMADMAHIAGLVATGQHPNPVPFCDIVTSTTHKTLRGPRGGLILSKKKFIKKINSQIFPGIQGGPLMHVIAAKAVCFKEAMSDDFKKYQKQVLKNAVCFAETFSSKGFRIVSGGTDNHLMLLDLRPKKLTGNILSTALDKALITVNQNLIPFDPEKPTITSGVRIGTTAVTTRGMQEAEMKKIAGWISQIADDVNNTELINHVREKVIRLTEKFPIMPGI